MKKLYDSLFLNNRLFYILGVNAVLFVLGFFVPFFFDVARAVLLVVVVLTFVDILTLYGTRKAIKLERVLPERLSNGDENRVQLSLESRYNFPVHITIIEELPYQFQKFRKEFAGGNKYEDPVSMPSTSEFQINYL